MLKILGILISGVILGYLLRERVSLRWVSRGTTILIYLLLLVLGIAVGSNDTIVNNLSTIGLKGVAIASATTLGSIIMAKVVYMLMYKKER